jgi:DNA-binding protein H-NS
MATKTLAQIQAQIDKLNREAEAIRTKQVAAVVERIKGDIAEFGLTAEDLGLVASRGPVRKSRAAAVESKAPAVKGSKSKARKKAAVPEKPAKAAKRASAGKAAAKANGAIKYADEQGHTWTGVGKRPGWFLAALEEGKTAEDLLVSSAGT